MRSSLNLCLKRAKKKLHRSFGFSTWHEVVVCKSSGAAMFPPFIIGQSRYSLLPAEPSLAQKVARTNQWFNTGLVEGAPYSAPGLCSFKCNVRSDSRPKNSARTVTDNHGKIHGTWWILMNSAMWIGSAVSGEQLGHRTLFKNQSPMPVAVIKF